MPDQFDANGLQVKTINEIIADLEAGYRSIYGADINLDQNSPDGQTINLFAQSAVDLRELLVSVNKSFDPDFAVGQTLSSRVALNNIERAGGTYTIVPIDIVVDRTVALQGLDADFNNPDGAGFTISDNAGNEFILIDTQNITAGSYTVNFRARQIGEVNVTLNTIQNPVTIVLGVTSIDNTSAPLEIGQEEETDAELRFRRQQSVALGATGYLNGLLGDVLNLDGVTDGVIFENITNVVDADGIPAHGIWLIAEGGSNEEIANEIYGNKSYGADMRGDVEINITTQSGAIFVAKFDRPIAEDLYIRFDIQPTVPGATFDLTAIRQYIVDNITYNINQFAETSAITCAAVEAISSVGGGGVPVNVEISLDGISYFDYLETTTKKNQFTLDVSRIAITEL